MPLGIAPGMGLNAYFAYNVVGFHGSGNVSYKTALAAIFVEVRILLCKIASIPDGAGAAQPLLLLLAVDQVARERISTLSPGRGNLYSLCWCI